VLAVANPAASVAIDAFFLDIVKQQMKAFEERCHRLYGHPPSCPPGPPPPFPPGARPPGEAQAEGEGGGSRLSAISEVFARHGGLAGPVDLAAFEKACHELGLRHPGFLALARDPVLLMAAFSSLHAVTATPTRADRGASESPARRLSKWVQATYIMVEAEPDERARHFFRLVDRWAPRRVRGACPVGV
jgi:hypothetical protein